MPKDLITWEAVKDVGEALTSVTNVVKGTGDLVSSRKEKKFNSELRNIEKKTIIKVAEDRGKYVRTMHQIQNVTALSEQVDSITNTQTKKYCQRLLNKVVNEYVCDD